MKCKKYHIVLKDNVVAQVFAGSGPEGAIESEENVPLGSRLVDGQFVTPDPTPEEVEIRRETALTALKLECQQAIFAVVDQNTQSSLIAALVSGALSDAEKATFARGQQWIESVKAESRKAGAEGRDPVWPEAPEDVVALAKKY